jgi:hypothetical protein
MTATSASADAMHVDPALQTATQIDPSLLTQSNITINQAMDAAQYVSRFEVYDSIVELKKSNKIVDEVTPLVAVLRNSETDYRQQVDRFVTGSSGANPNDLIRSRSNRVNAGLALAALMNERHNRQFLPRVEADGADVLEINVITVAREIVQIKKEALELKNLIKAAVDKEINDRETLRSNMQEENVTLQSALKSSGGL